MTSVRVTTAARQGAMPAASIACVTAIISGLMATSCSANPAGGADATLTPPAVAASPTAPVSGYDALIRLPLSAYGTSEKDDDLVFRTRKALIVRCMKSRGHQDYTGQSMTRIVAKTAADKEALRPAGAWGYIGRAAAKSRAFHGVETPTGPSGLSGRAAKDFEACSAEADKHLPSLTGTDGWKLTQSLFGHTDRRVAAARTRWAACMNTAGHPAKDPEKLAAGPWNTAKPLADEIAAATADEACTRSSDLTPIYFAVLTGYQQQMVSANSAALTAYQKQAREAVGQAARLLAGE